MSNEIRYLNGKLLNINVKIWSIFETWIGIYFSRFCLDFIFLEHFI